MGTYTDMAKTHPATVRSLYTFDQAHEATKRTRRILDRITPKWNTPHGFYNFEAFILSSIMRSEQVNKAKQIGKRIEAKIKARDQSISIEEAARRMDASTGA